MAYRLRCPDPRVLLLASQLAVLTACGGSDNPPTPPPSNQVVTNLDSSQWQFQYSPNMSQHPEGAAQGWQFYFPQQDGVHYLVQLVSGHLGSQVALTYQLQKSNDVQFIESNPCPPNPMNAQVRLYFQRRGDDLSGAGVYEFFRWFSTQGDALSADSGGLTIPLSPEKWTSVMGKTGDVNPTWFAAAVQDVQAVGMTFGGCFAGHGVYVQGGTANFNATGYSVQ